MSNGLIGIGLSGLAAAQAGMTTTSENIANVNTPGYSREATVQATADPIFTGGGFLGSGVDVTTITRSYNQYQQQELVQAQAGSSQLDTAYSQVQQIDNMLGTGTGTLSSALSTFFNSAQTLASNPTDEAARQTFLSNAQGLVQSLNGMGSQLQQLATSNDQQIGQTVTAVNGLAQQIAALNEQITNANGASSGQQPNALLDQRDSLVQQLNQDIGATTITHPDGSIDVFVGNGQPLVVGNTANSLTTVPSAADPTQLQLGVQEAGTTLLIGSSQVSGGSLAGLLQFRDQSLIPAQNAVGRIAINLAAAVNAQNELGQDQNGNPGAALFSTGSPQVTAASTNTGTATVSATITNPGQLTTDNYRLQMVGGQYVVTDLTTQSSQTYASLPQTIAGVTISATAGMANGDSFTIDPTINGATQLQMATSDPSAIAVASPVQANVAVSNSGTAAVAGIAATSQNANLTEPVTLDFHVAGGVTTYDVVDTGSGTVLSAGNSYTAGTPITYNGWSLSLSGTPADGDSVAVTPNTVGNTDNTNALALANLQNAPVIGSLSLPAAYQQLVGSIGTQTQQLQSTSQAQDNVLTQAQSARDSTAGVNLDEEAANLLKYQQAYQASSQMIATANSMFASIIALFQNLP